MAVSPFSFPALFPVVLCGFLGCPDPGRGVSYSEVVSDKLISHISAAAVLSRTTVPGVTKARHRCQGLTPASHWRFPTLLKAQFLSERTLNLASQCSKGGVSQAHPMLECKHSLPLEGASYPASPPWHDTWSFKEELNKKPGS